MEGTRNRRMCPFRFLVFLCVVFVTEPVCIQEEPGGRGRDEVASEFTMVVAVFEEVDIVDDVEGITDNEELDTMSVFTGNHEKEEEVPVESIEADAEAEVEGKLT